MRAFLYLAVLFSVVSVIVGQTGYGRRRPNPQRPHTQPPLIHPAPTQCPRGTYGPCRINRFPECPHGSTCQRSSPFSGAGQCCIDPPVTQPGCYGSCSAWGSGSQCASGYTCRNSRCCPVSVTQPRCYGSCVAWGSGSQCASGYTCRNQRCCPDSDNTDCIRDSFCGGIAAIPCHHGYECRYDGTFPDAGGRCCRPQSNQNDRCPPSSNRFTTCQFDPRRNCLSDNDCSRGSICCQDGCGKVCTRIQYPRQTY